MNRTRPRSAGHSLRTILVSGPRRLFFRFLLIASAAAVVITTAVTAPAYADQPCGNGFSVGGRIEQEYVYLGGSGALGNCTTKELTADRNGKFQEFQNDGQGGKTAIYWNASVANGYAKMVRGEIYKRWTFYGWERGALGFPTISEAQLATRGGKYNTFEGGSIYWSPNTGAHTVFGAIRDKWAQANYEKGTYGYPTTDEYELDGGIEQQFEGGTITYNPGDQADGDPTDTNAEFGKDDPRVTLLGRFDSDTPNYAAECFTTNTSGEKFCSRLGTSTETNDDSPPVDVRLRQAPSPGSSSSTTPPPSSAEPSTSPSSAPPESSSELPTSSTSVPTSSPSSASAAPSSTPTSTTALPQASRKEFDGAQGSVGSAFSHQQAPRIVLADAPKPGLGGVKEPPDPTRDFAGEIAYFSSDTDCKGSPPIPNKQYAGRFYACAVIPYVYQKINAAGDENEGWSKGYLYTKQKADPKSLTTVVSIKVAQLADAGEIGDVTTRMSFAAEGGTVGGNGQDYIQEKPLASSPEFTINVTMPDLGSTNQVRKMVPGYRFLNYYGDYEEKFGRVKANPLKSIRCDSMVYIKGQGCVMAPGAYQSGKPIMDLGDRFFPGKSVDIYRNHILRAVNSLLPGGTRDPFGRTLTRIEYRSKQAANNRVQACAPARTRPYKPSPTSSWQCDEYPFASTAEGAALDPAGGRTFNFCKFTSSYGLPIYGDFDNRLTGYSSCIIPTDQNRTGGSIIPTFNRKNRILFAQDRVGNDPVDGFMVYPYP